MTRTAMTGAPRTVSSISSVGLVAASAILWGTIGLFVRAVDAPALVITFYRVTIAAVAAIVIVAARPSLAAGSAALWRLRWLVAGMVTFYTFNWVLLFFSIKLTTIGNAVLAYYTAPAFMAVLGAVFLRERVTASVAAAVGLAFIGLAIVFGPATSGGHNAVAGLLCGVAAGFLYAGAVVMAKPLRQHVTPWMTSLVQTVGATVLLAPLVALSGDRLTGFSAVEWGTLLLLGLLHTTAAFALFFTGIRRLDAQTVGFVMYLDPLTAVLTAALLLGERLSASQLVGGALIVASGLYAVLKGEETAKRLQLEEEVLVDEGRRPVGRPGLYERTAHST